MELILGYPKRIHNGVSQVITFICLYLYEYQKLRFKIPFVAELNSEFDTNIIYQYPLHVMFIKVIQPPQQTYKYSYSF